MPHESSGAESNKSLQGEIDRLKQEVAKIPDDELVNYMQEKPDFQRRLVKILGEEPHNVDLVTDVCQDTLEWHMIMNSTPPFQVEPDLSPDGEEVRRQIRQEIRSFVRDLREKYLGV